MRLLSFALLAAALSIAACAAEDPAPDGLELSFTADAPDDGRAFQTLRIQFWQQSGSGGATLFPASPVDPDFNLAVANGADLLSHPLVVDFAESTKFDVVGPGESTFRTEPNGERWVTLYASAWTGTDLVAWGSWPVDLTLATRMHLHLVGVAPSCDSDGDGYIACTDPACCEGMEDAPSGMLDCDAGEKDISPTAVERCNLIDDDCDGVTDELFSTLCQQCDGDDPESKPDGLWVCDLATGSTRCEEPPLAETCTE